MANIEINSFRAPEKVSLEVLSSHNINNPENIYLIAAGLAGGHEPGIIVGSVATSVIDKLRKSRFPLASNIRILMPYINENQVSILREECRGDEQLFLLDFEYGNMIREFVETQGDYPKHLQILQRHYEKVDEAVQRHFARHSPNTINVRTLTTNDEIKVSPVNLIFTLDAGARVSVNAPLRYFVFPELLSRLLREGIEANKRGEVSFDPADMFEVAEKMWGVEKKYSQVFIPQVNPLSFMYADNLSAQPDIVDKIARIYTPPLKHDMSKDNETFTGEEGIYVMFSGTGKAKKDLLTIIKTAQEQGIKVYIPPWVKVKDGTSASAGAIKDPKIKAVIARPGWGTLWQTMQLEKGVISPPVDETDDVEMLFTQKTVEALKLGLIVKPEEFESKHLAKLMLEVSPGLKRLKEHTKTVFGTADGIEFVAERIAKHFLEEQAGK